MAVQKMQRSEKKKQVNGHTRTHYIKTIISVYSALATTNNIRDVTLRHAAFYEYSREDFFWAGVCSGGLGRMVGEGIRKKERSRSGGKG